MKKNTASQVIGAQMVSASDGSAFTGAVTCYVTGDGGTQAAGSVGSGACTHEGNGFHTYAPAQAETNYDHIAFTFTGSGAVPATVQVYPNFPQTGDAFARLGAPAGASVSADIAAMKGDTAAILLDTGTDGVVVAAASKSGYSLTATTGLGNQTANITGNLSGSVGSVTGAVGSVTGAVGSVTGNVGGNVTGSVGSLATQAKADVNAEVDTAISDAALATAAALATVDGIVDDLQSGIIYGAAATGTLSTTVATSNLTGYADDQLIGRVIIWLSGNCEGEASAITDYASLNGTITFDALTTAPANADTFKIV